MEAEAHEKTAENEETGCTLNPEHGAVAGGCAERRWTLTEAAGEEIAAGGGRVTLASSARVDDATVEDVAITASSTAPENVGDVAGIDGSEFVEDVTAGGAAGDALETTGGVSEEIMAVESAAAAAGGTRVAALGVTADVAADCAATEGLAAPEGKQRAAVADAVDATGTCERGEAEERETEGPWERPRARKTIKACTARAPVVCVMSNAFEDLERLEVESKPRVFDSEGGQRLWAEQSSTWCRASRRRTKARVRHARPDRCNNVEEVKAWLWDLSQIDISVPIPGIPFFKHARDAFWDRVALHRLRFKQDKRWYLRVRAADEARPILQLHVPPKGLSKEEQAAHARLQATADDDLFGVLDRGRRINVEALQKYGFSEDMVREGQEGVKMEFIYSPPQYRGRNYGGALDYPAKLQAEFERLHARGWIEGPLLYAPHIVNGLGGVWKEDKDKWRTVLNARSSGLNAATEEVAAKLDSLQDVLRHSLPNQLMSGIDLADAFLAHPYSSEFCDLWGMQDANGDFWRYRFLAFGGKASPGVQQRWINALGDVIEKHGLKFTRAGSEAASRRDGFKVAGKYLDDMHILHPVGISVEAAREQFESVHQLILELGFDAKRKKDQLPATVKEYLGMVIDTEGQTVTITQERAEALKADIAAFRERCRVAHGVLSRREVARLTGKLQWVAEIVLGGQRHLRQLYRARDNFVDKHIAESASSRQQWSDNVKVRVGEEVEDGLAFWEQALTDIPTRPIFLSNLRGHNGFWKGDVDAFDDEIDAAAGCVEGEDIEVITTDASGWGAGAWWRHHRFQEEFKVGERAPAKSSNWREAMTVVMALERWGAQLRGRRVLVRSDNTTTVSILNKLDTGAETLEAVASALLNVCQKYDLRVSGRHIKGVENKLADALSRDDFEYDKNDWQLLPSEFAELSTALGQFTVDAFADGSGSNAMVARHWSRADDAFSHDWKTEAVYANPPWELLEETLLKGKESVAACQGGSCTVVAPAWLTAAFWRKTKGWRVAGLWPAGTSLFTAPARDGASSNQRRFLGPTRWDTVALHLPARARTGGVAATAGGGAQQGGAGMQVLSGDGARDHALLQALRPQRL